MDHLCPVSTKVGARLEAIKVLRLVGSPREIIPICFIIALVFMKFLFRSHRRAFTTTELLVAIGILLLLILLASPVFNNVTQSQGAVRCVANLRQLGALFQSFANDHRGAIHLYYYPPDAGDKPWADMLTEKGYIDRRSHLQVCPTVAPRTYTARGSIYGTMRPTAEERASVPYDFSPPEIPERNPLRPANRAVRLYSVPDPARYWLLTDSWSSNRNEQVYIVYGSEPKGAYIHFRHDHRANMLFADGHVEAVAPERAKSLPYYPLSIGFDHEFRAFNF
ncbi:MAG TPA: H-X9-DG-CTERM domain-containing protein [Chthoniobacteraceae bacterium]|nr:H-X9-DG-CTERM domain-containing protein [Chthoniobacteraceae bacterium]